MCCHCNHCGVLTINATGEYHMKSYNTSIQVLLRHLTYWGILGKGVAATPNVSKGLSRLSIKSPNNLQDSGSEHHCGRKNTAM